MKRTRILAAIMSVTMMSSFMLPAVYAEDAGVESRTPGIGTYEDVLPSGIVERINGNIKDVVDSFGEDALVFEYPDYYGNQDKHSYFVITKDLNCYYFYNDSKYSAVTMREGTEPPVSKITGKIKDRKEYQDMFYRIEGTDQYLFNFYRQFNAEDVDTVYDILKNDENVLAIEEREDVVSAAIDCNTIVVRSEMSVDDFISQYPEFALGCAEDGFVRDNYNYCVKIKKLPLGIKRDPSYYSGVYEALKRLTESGTEFDFNIGILENTPDKIATDSKVIYEADASQIKQLIQNFIDQNYKGDAWITEASKSDKEEYGILYYVQFRSPRTNEPWFDYDAITSEFEKFFKEHNIDPSSVPVGFNEGNAPVSEKIGDVDLNGTIDVTDLTDISLALLGDKELKADQQKAADIDGDGSVTLADLARLQQYLSKKIDEL